MGMFSYTCTKCGPKDQFDWADQCVLKIGDIYVRGLYDGYGRVNVRVQGGGDDTKSTVVAYTKELRMFATQSPDALLATQIFCDGGGDPETEAALLHGMAQQQMSALRAFMMGQGEGSSDDDEEQQGCNRHCAPDGIAILEALDASMMESLPKAFKKKKKKKQDEDNRKPCNKTKQEEDRKPSSGSAAAATGGDAP